MRGQPIRRPILIGLLVAVVLVAAALTGILLSQRHIPKIAAEGDRTNILLLAVDGAEPAHGDAVILLSLSTDDAVFLSVPSEMRIKASGGTFAEIGDACGRIDGETARCEVSDFLGVEIPFYIAFDEASIGRLFEEIGGLTLSIDERLVFTDIEGDPPMEIELRPGDHTLDAASTLAFFRGLPGDEVRVARQQQALMAALDAAVMAPTFRTVQQTARTMHPLLETNLSTLDLCDVAKALRDLGLEGIELAMVPAVRQGEGEVSFLQPKVVEAERMVAELIEGLDLLIPSEVSVAVFNGNGVRQMASRTAAYLRDRGFPVTRVGNAESFDYPTSYIVVLTDESKAWMLRDALPSSVSIVFPESFQEHYQALEAWIPDDTDLILIAGEGMELN